METDNKRKINTLVRGRILLELLQSITVSEEGKLHIQVR